MHQRSVSAIFVVVGGLLPALLGGPVWAAAVAMFATIGLAEYHSLVRATGVVPLNVAYLSIWFGCVAAVGGWGQSALIGSLALGVGASSIAVLLRQNAPGSLSAWALEVAGAAYLTTPVIAAIELREVAGDVSVGWVGTLADRLSLGWSDHERGLAWLLFVMTVTWLGDTGAYLFGRAFGTHPLIPAISPKKTVEGLVGGLVTGVLFGALANELLGMGLPILAAALAALVLGIIGVIGDLTESLLKRQANVKDSGSLIPGHGGMLDRLDALLFTWTAGWCVALLSDRLWT